MMDPLVRLPWWVSLLLGAFVYAVLTWGLPAQTWVSPVVRGLVSAGRVLAPYLALLFVVAAAASFWRRRRDRQLLDRQRGIETIRSLSWQAFERVLAEHYRREGFAVRANDGAGADGGVDLTLVADGNKTLVQCKHWRARKVGVSVVREMFGLMVAEQAQRVIVACTGDFTVEARRFAAGKPIELIDGNGLDAIFSAARVEQGR